MIRHQVEAVQRRVTATSTCLIESRVSYIAHANRRDKGRSDTVKTASRCAHTSTIADPTQADTH